VIGRVWRAAATAGLLAGLVTPRPAAALDGGAPPNIPAGGPSVEIRIIQGFHTDGGALIDGQLADLPQLTQEQPFLRYNVYHLLDTRRFPLTPGQTVTYGLVNGRTLQVSLAGVVENRSEKRYKMEAQILEPGKRAFLKSLQVTAGPNQPFFVGGQQYQGGMLFVELVVRG
jgi:hypothetical protein